ncbi:MAG: trypsin-like peptidase domain-containing protein [Planctomycetes bacterium]|nr:trypsin-like peptidase domain-containing protein [Planctomycetota bacterium]
MPARLILAVALAFALASACSSCALSRTRSASDSEKASVASALIPAAPIGEFRADWRTFLRERNVIVIAGAEIEDLEVSSDGVSGSFGFTYRPGSYAGAMERGNAAACIRPGYFLTCAHVVVQRPISIIVNNGDSWSHALGEVVWWDRDADLALIRAPISAPAIFDLAAAPPEPGSVVVAGSSQGPSAGHVIGLSGGTALAPPDRLTCDLPTKPGDSGGALVDVTGRLVGVVTRVTGPGAGVHDSAILVPDRLERIVADAVRAAESP